MVATDQELCERGERVTRRMKRLANVLFAAGPAVTLLVVAEWLHYVPRLTWMFGFSVEAALMGYALGLITRLFRIQNQIDRQLMADLTRCVRMRFQSWPALRQDQHLPERSGQVVKMLGIIPPLHEYDTQMYRVQFDDGFELDAYVQELQELPEPTHAKSL